MIKKTVIRICDECEGEIREGSKIIYFQLDVSYECQRSTVQFSVFCSNECLKKALIKIGGRDISKYTVLRIRKQDVPEGDRCGCVCSNSQEEIG